MGGMNIMRNNQRSNCQQKELYFTTKSKAIQIKS